MTDAVERVWAEIDRDRDFAVELTREMVRVPSVNPKFQIQPGLNRESDVQDLVERQLDEDGFATDRWEVSKTGSMSSVNGRVPMTEA